MTVSRALRGERRVDPALVEKIRATAAQMGYVPDPAARALASQKSAQVLVLVPMLSNTLFVDLIEAVHKELFAAGYHALIGVTHYDRAEKSCCAPTCPCALRACCSPALTAAPPHVHWWPPARCRACT
jgi:LacI family gluconate utilization system Gnt-I transcriptional repressor